MEFNKTTGEAEAHLTHCKSHCNQNRKLCLMNAMMTMPMTMEKHKQSAMDCGRQRKGTEQEERVGDGQMKQGIQYLSLSVFLFLAE